MAVPQTRSATNRQVIRSVVRIVVGVVLLLALYAFAPLGQRPVGSVLVSLVVSLLVLAIVVGWQIVAVTRSAVPLLKALEAIAVSVLLLLLIFACIYYVAGLSDPSSFSEPLTRIDAVYFSVTMFATVGFGDIAAASQTTRVLVTVQMLLDLILIGVITKVLVGAAQRRHSTLTADADRSAGGTQQGDPPRQP